jgi:hypothetical protein
LIGSLLDILSLSRFIISAWVVSGQKRTQQYDSKKACYHFYRISQYHSSNRWLDSRIIGASSHSYLVIKGAAKVHEEMGDSRLEHKHTSGGYFVRTTRLGSVSKPLLVACDFVQELSTNNGTTPRVGYAIELETHQPFVSTGV